MTRRLTILVGALSIIVAIVIGVALLVWPSRASHVGTLGTIDPTSTTTLAHRTPQSQRVTYPTATTVPPAAPPASLEIPAIGLDATIVAVGLVAGTTSLEIPDIDHVGWYRLGPSPGQTGSAVLVGHVDGNNRPGIFWRLRDLTPGARITVTYKGTRPRTFRVIGRQQVAKTQLPAELFSRTGPPRLALITCGGAFNTTTRHYNDNVVIVAAAT